MADATVWTRPAGRCALATLLLWLAAGCADQQRARESELKDLLAWLPGTWDNSAQVREETAAGAVQPHEPLVLQVLRIDAPRMGRNAFYVQEAAAEDPRRIMRQLIVTFAIRDHAIREQRYALLEPRRWRDAQRDPDVFRSLTAQDLRELAGCELTWERSGERFTAHDDAQTCHATAGEGPPPARSDLRAELDAHELALAERHYDGAGQLLLGRADASFYRFTRRAQ